MADSDEWFVGEDGCLSVGQPTNGVTYHSTLNTILVATKEPAVKVLDVTSGLVLQSSDLSACRSGLIKCHYLAGQDKMFFTDGYVVGVRKDLNGILLLDTALQRSISRTEDTVSIDLSLPDATHLYKCLMEAELPGVDYVEDVLRELEKEIERTQQATKGNHKIAKWATVCLRLSHCALKCVCSNLVQELKVKRLHQQVPGLPIASAITDRLSYLLPSQTQDVSSNTVDRSLMYSEAARRLTFMKWPHMNYKWALPEAMAQAGFYHQPSSTGDDRAMCFTCNVCLVCWEPTDEPWSEHERHYPTCPFVKGEYTQNVPMAVSYATDPAILHADKGSADQLKIECVSTTSSDDYVATSSLHGNIVIWNVACQLKKYLQFNIDPWEPMIAIKTGCQLWKSEEDGAEQTKEKSDEEETTGGECETDSKPVPPEESTPNQEMVGQVMEESVSDDNKSKTEIIEVTGAWKHGANLSKDEVSINDMESHPRETFQRCRPSQDVLVSALCVLGPPPNPSLQAAAAAAASPASTEPSPRPCLISGVGIRRNTLSLQGFSEVSTAQGDSASEVQAMNQVNQALSGDSTPQIISDSSSSSQTPSPNPIPGMNVSEKQNPFVPYLLVHDITKHKKGLQPWKSMEKGEKQASTSVGSSHSYTGTKMSQMIAPAQDCFYPPIMEIEEEDPDVQILSFPLSLTDNMIKYSETPSLVPAKSNNNNNLSDTSHTHSLIGSTKSIQSTSTKDFSSNISVESLPQYPLRKEGCIVQCIELPPQVTPDQYVSSITPTTDSRHVVVVTAPKCLHQNISCVDNISANTINNTRSPEIQHSYGNNNQGSSSSSIGSPELANDDDGGGGEVPSNPDSMDCTDTSNVEDTGDNTPVSMSEQLSGSTAGAGGCLMVYSVAESSNDLVLLQYTPKCIYVNDNIEDTITSVLMLPKEICQMVEEDDMGGGLLHGEPPHGSEWEVQGDGDGLLEGQIAVTTHRGDIKILRLTDCKTLATISAPDRDKFVSVSYCTGMDRLCACTKEGKLHFYIISPHGGPSHEMESDFKAQMSPVRGGCSSGSANRDEPMDTNMDQVNHDDLLVHQPLSTENLQLMHELTQFENLMPRFSATVPPCWTEIQQEQQQRRHPQHLQQQGENMQHTRTWRLQSDSSSYDEHLFELVLPRTCSLGHIDVKFQLHPMCTAVPTIQVTLLKQNISNIGRQSDSQASGSAADVDAKIDFIRDLSGDQATSPADRPFSFTASDSYATSPSGSQQHLQASVINNVLDPQFLKRYSAEILCGPVDLASHVDLSGHSGVISLASPQLLKVKSRSFLVHIKALSTGKEEEEKGAAAASAASAAAASASTCNNKKNSRSGSASPNNPNQMPTTSPPPQPKDKAGLKLLSAAISGSKAKIENIKGCDWLQEVSITVRRCKRSKKTSIPRDRLQRLAIVENVPFHEQLMVAACGQDENMSASTSVEHRQGLALDILAWIAALQMNDPTHRIGQSCIVLTVQSNLKGLLKACFVEGGRSSAHRCAKFISLCIEFSKNIPDPNLAPAFNYALLRALLELVTLLPSVNSAGALHWYFTLLNRVKCMDIAGTGQRCADMLAQVARQYHERTNPLHSLLKARFGLYGAPLDPVLFDIGPPQFMKPGASSNNSSTTTTNNNNNATTATSSIFGVGTTVPNNNNNNTSSTTATAGVADEIDIRDLLSINAPEKSGKTALSNIQHHICGLLEVEPLHFTCHATSDGTRMERMDAGNGGTTVSSTNTGLPGTINFGEAIPSVTAAGAALASLSTAMASAEQQLQLLQQKQLHLAKLQQQKQKLEQKLAENKQAITGSGQASTSTLGTSFVPYTSELLPPTPKTTPLFNTPPLTPPNESYLYHPLQESSDPGKPPVWKPMVLSGANAKISGLKSDGTTQKLPLPQTQHLLQAPPPQVLVIERMPSGARRFVVIDFGKPVLLTDVIVPACGDLASLSIDTWVQGEEIDGQRLVVSTDIGIRSLIMNDLMPSPVCRYLKITTIGRYSGGTTRSRIPIGSFYGHTTLLPWECDISLLPSLSDIPPNPVNPLALDQSHILSQLGMFVALQEDIQCRYSLACNRLTSLLTAIDMPHSNSSHTKYYLKKTKKTEEDLKIQQAYYDCMQLQLQLNLAQRAISRLQRALGMPQPQAVQGQNMLMQLKHASTDQLRCLVEQLLNTLLSMTYSTPTIPQLPPSLYTTFTPAMAESLFRNLCVNGTRRMQIHAGVLLVRLCGNQNWWGDFLGSVLQDYFASEQPEIFPQDRVFLLVTALGQKSLGGASASDVLESILSLLARLLAPLSTGGQNTFVNSASLDLCLIGWLLLFLSRNLDSTGVSSNLGDDEKNGKDNPGPSSSRWDFIQGESAMQNNRLSSRTSSSKLYRRKLQKRLMHHKQQLMDIQAAKKSFLSSQMDKATLNLTKEVEALMKQQEQLFKKQLKQYSSKHFKDIMQIRRTDGELLKKLPKDNGNGPGPDAAEVDSDLHITVVRAKVIPVVQGLVALLLSMDFTCNVDLFLITCKVVARLTNVTRPTVMLSEVMSQEDLEQLMLLCCNLEFNHGNINWGGAWASHSITCLLQDILDGERLYPASQSYSDGVTDDEMSSTSMEADPPPSTCNAPSMETDQPSTSEGSGAEAKEDGFKFDKESSLIVDMILDEEEYDEETNAKLQEYIMVDVMLKPMTSAKVTVSYNYNNQNNAGKAPGTIFWGPASGSAEQEDKKQKFELWKNKLATIVASKANVVPQGISTAMDSRLENSLELTAELRLKVMVSLETESVQNAISAPLPPPIPGLMHNYSQSTPTTDDEQLGEPPFPGHSNTSPPIVPSHEMLSVCFNNLFAQLSLQRVNVDALLTAYLTLNDEASQEDSSQTAFFPSKAPSISLSPQSVTSLLATLAWSPNVPVRTWVLAFQVLSLIANLKCPSNSSAAAPSTSAGPSLSSHGNSGEKWLATVMVADSNMMAVLIKFLSGTSIHGPVISSHQYTQVGPTAVRAFQELLSRLQLRCTEESKKHLKELMLKLVYTLAIERGAFHSGLGPLDAQCKLLEHMLDQTYDHVDVSNAISVIDSLSVLVHQHILGQERVVCRSSSENSISARSCFCGLFASVLRSSDSRTVVGDANRDVLMCHLLKLVNVLVQVPLSGRSNGAFGGAASSGGHRRSNAGNFSDLSGDFTAVDSLGGDSAMTDANKINQSLASGRVSASDAPKSDDEKGAETDEQKRETAASSQIKKVRSCSHFSDVLNPENDYKEPTLSDVVLSHPQIMQHLLQALSCCNSNTMAMILSSSGLQGNLQEAFTGIDPLSVGDGIFQILCTLNKKASDVSLVLKPMLDYLSSGFHGIRQAGICRLSEPLLWFILNVLDCGWSIRAFLGMSGVEVICSNLVQANRRVINVSPSLVSTIMQYLGNSKSSSSSTKRLVDTDTNDGLQNFAPLGTISSTSPTAGPADVLLQASPPHRRARSAAWSYHFYPDEAWVDLTITLPCAVQLKEIHIQPHLTSLATCPAAVSVEVSRDGTMMMPICAPKITSGLTFIKIHLLKCEVVTVVTIRLHKPRDSTTIGLSQIMLLGCTAFGDTGSLRSSNVFLPTEDYVSRTCIGWLRLLHHCLTQSETISDEVAAAASRTQNLMITCTALLVSPSATLYATSIEAVLLKIGLHSNDMGMALISNLLRNSNIANQEGTSLPLHGKVSGIANESTIDILYQLGMTQDSATLHRMKALLTWLEDSARLALQRARSAHQDSGYSSFSRRHTSSDLPAPAPAHIYSIAAVFWASQELGFTYNWEGLVTERLLSELYNWSTILTVDSALKKAVDTVMCSLCYMQPQFFKVVLTWLGVPSHLDFGGANLALGMAMTDDLKDSVHYRQPEPNRESMTDDSKEANNAMSESGVALDMGNMDSPVSSSLSQLCLDEPRLLTLAMACQSPQALQMLLNSGLPMILCQGLFEFCTREMIRHNDTVGSSMEGMTDACKSAGVSGEMGTPESGASMNETEFQPRTEPQAAAVDNGLVITADLVAPVLKFLAEVSKECVMKEWLGSAEGRVFWPALLHLLCNTVGQNSPLHLHTELATSSRKHKMMTSQQRACIETATVNFFTNVISCHSENQRLFADVLCDVIRGQGASSEDASYSTCALSGFTRRLFLQVLLEDEKVLVSFRSSSQLYKGQTSSLSTLIQHPRCGAGHKYRAMHVSLHSTCEEVLAKVTDTPSFTAQLLEEKNGERKGTDDKKDTSELGLEVVDQISAAAGLQAKEKREKKSQTPPRPPSRRGHRLPDISGPLHVLSLSLYHNMLPGQPMPSDLTLSQLLVLLTERGLQPGQAMLDFTMKLRAKKVNSKGEKRLKTDEEVLLDGDDPDIEVIPDEVLLATPSFPSSLQVFAGVGGLALLAEHLPLLYPEVTRQATPPTISTENNNVSGLGSDWVTVESTEDIYEEIYEPMPPSQTSQSSKQASQVLPTIPPHSLVAFGLFLRLPGYAEVLLKERKRAQCLLRLVLGVTDDGEGGHILTSPIASALPTLPFHVLKSLFDSTPLTTDDGVLLRRMALEIGAVHLVLACLSVLSHHAPRAPIPGFHQEIILAATQAASTLGTTTTKVGEDKTHSYWAKGTGFGTGSTTSSWDAEQAFIRQRSEEEHVTCLLQVLSSYVNPGGHVNLDEENMKPLSEDGISTENNSLPAILPDLLSQSCLVPAISSYLRNDSVLDMARHVPLYRGLLELLRAIAMCHLLVPLLLPLSGDDDSASSVGHLLDKMKTCVDTYASRLKTNKSKSSGGSSAKNKQEEEETEGLALLIPDIQRTARIVHASSSRMRERHSVDTLDTAETETQGATKSDHSQEERYIEIMRPLQFDTYEMVADEESGLRFTLAHHYESNVKAAGEVNNAARARRLAQEAVTLSTSLPLSHSSSVFVRCDEDRLDVMKVLITGPSDTPYANGCFEFDVYFPQDYPSSPPLINLETTGNHTVRFNPNLYNDGKVCLSVLNTWHGRPEEKWNPQTSSFLQVLVSIQSLILVSEPYFNEPGYERSRGTASGTASSREYDANIRQATVKWAMLEQLRNPSACFRDVIERHFWLKKSEIMAQVEEWITELEAGSSDKRTGRTISHSCLALKRHYNQLKDELNKMKSPEGLGGVDEDDDNTDTSHSLGAENMDTLPQSQTDSEADLSKKSPSSDSASNLEKNLMDEAGGQHSGSKDMSPSSSGMMLMNHLDAVDSIVNDMMEPSMMNSMLFDSSAHNSLDIDDDLQLYHL